MTGGAESDGRLKVLYLPVGDLARGLGADTASRPFQQAQAIINTCNPTSQVAAIAIDEGILSQENFAYYSFLFNIGREATRP